MQRLYSILIIMIAFGQCVGCGKNEDLAEKMKKRGLERDEAAAGDVDAVVKKYVGALVDLLPEPGASAVDGVPAMVAWRKDVAAKSFSRICQEKYEELKDTPSAPVLLDGKLVFEALKDFWLGKEVRGPKLKKEWEEGYEASKKVAAKKGAREKIPLGKHMTHLTTLKKGENAKAWSSVLAFETLLPHVIQVYKFRSYKTYMQSTSFSPYWQVMFDYARKRDAEGPERFQPYRDRLCANKLKEVCNVPYESRDIAIRKVFISTLLERLEAFNKAHGGAGFEPLVARFQKDMKAELAKAVVPEEYPVLPSTASTVPTSLYTVLFVGPKGARIETDDPGDLHNRTGKDLMGPRKSWALDTTSANKLMSGLVEQLREWRGMGHTAEYTTELYLALDKAVPVSLIAHAVPHFEEAKIALLDLVARHRSNGTNKLQRIPLTVVDKDARKPLAVAGPSGQWSCLPVGTVGGLKVPPDLAKGFVFLSGQSVVAGTAGKLKKRAKLSGDLKAIGEWVAKLNQPVLVGVKGSSTYEDMHKLLSNVTLKCNDKACSKTALIEKVVVSVCR